MKPRLVILNADKVVPGDDHALKAAHAAGFEVIWVGGNDQPAVQFEPAVDRRFEAAKAAMQGLLAGRIGPVNTIADIGTYARVAVAQADALLAELDKPV